MAFSAVSFDNSFPKIIRVLRKKNLYQKKKSAFRTIPAPFETNASSKLIKIPKKKQTKTKLPIIEKSPQVRIACGKFFAGCQVKFDEDGRHDRARQLPRAGVPPPPPARRHLPQTPDRLHAVRNPRRPPHRLPQPPRPSPPQRLPALHRARAPPGHHARLSQVEERRAAAPALAEARVQRAKNPTQLHVPATSRALEFAKGPAVQNTGRRHRHPPDLQVQSEVDVRGN